jgi:adenylyltransferase/sulfurtransferase
LLTAGADSAFLVDVREPHEVEICRIDGSRHIAMREVAARIDDLPRDRRMLVMCHHGGRSRQVTDFLRAQGFISVSSVAGGIAAWAERIDPSIRRY